MTNQFTHSVKAKRGKRERETERYTQRETERQMHTHRDGEDSYMLGLSHVHKVGIIETNLKSS